MRKLWLPFAALLSIAAAAPCFAAGSPWSGTWKEDIAKDKLTGDTVVITAKGLGFHFSNGPIAYDFACDGKPYPTIGAGTIACTATSDGGNELVSATNGTIVSKQHRTFSTDSKLMNMKTTVIEADGSTSTVESVRRRKSGTTGLVGEWVDAKVAPTAPDVLTISVTGNMVHIEFLHSKMVVDAKLDGSDGKVVGPRVSPGTTYSYKSVSPNKLLFTGKLNGKVLAEGTLTLSPDGKSYTDVSWLAGKESEKTTEIFEKQ